MLERERRAAHVGQILDPLVPVVGEGKGVATVERVQPGLRGDERGDLDRERERARSGVLLPAVLLADRPRAGEILDGAPHHRRDPGGFGNAELAQLRGEDHGEGDLVELDAGPERTAVRIEALVPVTVGLLRGRQVREHAARALTIADGEEREAGLDRVSGPHEVVAARAVARAPPGDRQARDHGTRKRPVLVRLQNGGGDAGRPARGPRRAGGHLQGLGPGTASRRTKRRASRLVALDQRRRGQVSRALRRIGEPEGEHAARRPELAEQRDVPVLGPVELVGHTSVPREVLPAVGAPDEAGAPAGEARLGEKAERVLPGGGQKRSSVDPGGVVEAAAAEVRARAARYRVAPSPSSR